jgi:D-xylose transport system substrate-binding protein
MMLLATLNRFDVKISRVILRTKEGFRMKLFKGQRGKWSIIAGILTFSMLLSACGSANTSGNGNASSTPTASSTKPCTNIGVSLPETNTSFRWDALDRPLLDAAIKQAIPGATVNINNAQGSAANQQQQAQALITQGACILVVAPSDAQSAVSIVTAAKAKNIPVVSYDRLIPTSDIAAYVSFDNVQVGKVQGQYIADHYQQYVTANGNNNLVIINGSPTDNNALLFKQGLHDAIDPLISGGKLKNVYEQMTDWTAAVAHTDFEAALSRTNNKVAIAYVANDDMATSVIAALKTVHLDGKVLVTGQDASATAINNILKGEQAMTVYKPVVKEADATAQVVAALSKGQAVSSVSGATTFSVSGTNVPAILETPIAVDKTNIKDTIIKDKFYTAAQVCSGVPAGTDGVC